MEVLRTQEDTHRGASQRRVVTDTVGECGVPSYFSQTVPVPVDPDGDANSSHTLKPKRKVLLSQSHGTKARRPLTAHTLEPLVSARLLKSAIWRTAH